MKILIVGGGIAGVSLANFLQQQSQWEVTITEIAPELRTIGYNIGLYGNGQQVLEELGLYKKFSEFAYARTPPGPYNEVRDKDGHMLSNIDFNLLRFCDKSVASCSREDLHNLLIGNLDKNVYVVFNRAIEKIRHPGNTSEVTFTDGHVENFDLVVGADGMKSWVRENLVEQGRLGFYNWKIRLTWLPNGITSPRDMIEVTAASRMMWMMPSIKRCTVGFITIDKPGRVSYTGERPLIKILQERFDDLALASEIVKHLDPSEKVFDGDLTYVKMGKWYQDNVVLIGDAMHGISPIPGFGSSLALEDSYVLAQVLSGVNKPEEIHDALQEFSKKRNPKIIRVKRIVYVFEKLLITRTKLGTFIRNTILRIIPKTLLDRWLIKVARTLFADPF